MDETNDVPELPGYTAIKEAAKELRVHERQVYKYIEAGRLKAFRVSNVYVIANEELRNFQHRLSGRPRKKTPAWHAAVGKSAWLLIFAQLRVGQEAAFQQKLEAIRTSEAHTFPGTAARYIARSDQQPGEIQILLVWRGAMIPSAEAREARLEEFRRELAEVVDWQTARYETGQVVLHT